MSEDPLQQLSSAALKSRRWHAATHRGGAGKRGLKLDASVPLGIAGLVIVLSFCLPWWSQRIPKNPLTVLAVVMAMDQAEAQELQEKAAKVVEDKAGWYEPHQEKLEAKARGLVEGGISLQADPDKYISVRLWGWDIYQGYLSLAAGLAILAACIVPAVSRRIGTSQLIALAPAAAAVVPGVLAVIWWFTSPNVSLGPLGSMRVSFGTYAALVGALGGMISGAWAALAAQKASKPAAGVPVATAVPVAEQASPGARH